MKTYDVIVLGGGPAGSITAYGVAKAGYKVLLLDKKKREQIGDKTCGDAVDYAYATKLKNALDLEFPHGDELSDTIKTMSIAAGSVDTKFSLNAPGFLVDRHKYGQRLLKECETANVEIKSQAPVRGIIVENDTVVGVRYNNKATNTMQEARAKFTVDASGAYGSIRKELPSNMRANDSISHQFTPDMQWPTFRKIVELPTNHRWQHEILLLYKEDWPIPGYFWIFSKGERKLNVGIGWAKSEKNMPSLKTALDVEMSHYYASTEYKSLKEGGGQIPIRPPFDTLVFNGGLLVGDAAALVHPITAEGHGPALESGIHAANTLIHALQQNDTSADVLWQYNKLIMNHIGEKHASALLLRKFLENIGPRFLEKIIRRQILTNDEMDLLVRGLPLQISKISMLRKFVKLFPNYGVALQIKKILGKSAKLKELYLSYPENPDKLQQWRLLRNEVFAPYYKF